MSLLSCLSSKEINNVMLSNALKRKHAWILFTGIKVPYALFINKSRLQKYFSVRSIFAKHYIA